MNRPHDNRTQKDPQHGRDPAPDNGDGRSDNGTGAGDGREMMSENNLFFGWHIVASVLQFLGRCFNFAGQGKDFATDIFAV